MGLFCDESYIFHGSWKEGYTSRGTHSGDYQKIKDYLDRGKDVILIVDDFASTLQIRLTYVDTTGNAAGITVDAGGLKTAFLYGSTFTLDYILSADDLPDADDYQF